MLETVIIVGLATFRVASLLVQEDGPFGIFEKLRHRAGVLRPGHVGEMGFFGLLFSCIWCASFYTALLCGMLWLVFPIAVYFLAAWTIAIIVHKVVS